MADPRMERLADILMGHSLHLQPGESVLIECFDVPDEAVSALVERAAAAGALPILQQYSQAVRRTQLLCATEASMRLAGEVELHRMAAVDAYIAVRGSHNVTELADVPVDKMKLFTKYVQKPVHFDLRVKRGRWVVLRYPTASMAQLAGMSSAGFADFYFAVCTLDYGHLARAMQPLEELMNRTDRVRLVSPGTDLTFSIKGIPAVLCGGEHNIPDGEVFTAPVRESINGTIAFNAPTVYQGVAFDQVSLKFKDGQVVESGGSDPKRIEDILNTDEGARYTGEFAIGVNPRITRPMRDILFDEKIAGSVHLTPGQCYDEADNGNQSEVHWDLVLLQDRAHGGGELWFDDVLVRQDGLFVTPELQPLNPEALLAAG
jgi:aminopeptidase